VEGNRPRKRKRGSLGEREAESGKKVKGKMLSTHVKSHPYKRPGAGGGGILSKGEKKERQEKERKVSRVLKTVGLASIAIAVVNISVF